MLNCNTKKVGLFIDVYECMGTKNVLKHNYKDHAQTGGGCLKKHMLISCTDRVGDAFKIQVLQSCSNRGMGDALKEKEKKKCLFKYKIFDITMSTYIS